MIVTPLGHTARARAWALMRQLPTWTVGEIFPAASMQRGNYYAFVAALRRAGWVQRVGVRPGHGAGSGTLWRVRPEAPRDVRMPTPTAVAARELPPRQQAWNAMRILRTFTLGEVLRTAGISAGNLQHYVRALVCAQYVRPSGYTGRKRLHGQQQYRLVRNTGPLAPQVTKAGGVRDRNRGQSHG